MGMQVTLPDARDMIEQCIRAKLVAMLLGSPGGGKSAVIHQLAEEYNLKVIDVRLAQCDPTDLLGFPSVDTVTNKARYVPMSTFPIQGDAIPEGYSGWLLFLDEFNSADQGVQKAAYKLVLDKMVGEFHLHDKVAIVGAGNLETDNAIVEEMSTALQSRMVHMEMMVDPKAWLEWALTAGIDHRITSYIQFKPEELYRFNPDHEDKTFACPRTWEFASRLISKKKELVPLDRMLLGGTVSEGTAREFYGFTQIYKDLPTIAQIVASPESLSVPSEPSVQFAITGSIASHATTQNITQLMKFIRRLPVEFQVITVKGINRRNKEMVDQPAIREWVMANATEMF